MTRISSAVLDYETKSSYVLQVVAIDNDDPINLRIQFTLTITLNQINEPPTFDPVYFSISEAATSGTDLFAICIESRFFRIVNFRSLSERSIRDEKKYNCHVFQN